MHKAALLAELSTQKAIATEEIHVLYVSQKSVQVNQAPAFPLLRPDERVVRLRRLDVNQT